MIQWPVATLGFSNRNNNTMTEWPVATLGAGGASPVINKIPIRNHIDIDRLVNYHSIDKDVVFYFIFYFVKQHIFVDSRLSFPHTML